MERDWLNVATEFDPDFKRKMEDDELAVALLAGYRRGTGAVSFFKPGSNEENKARSALARRIRDQMPASFTREFLALAIDATTKSRLIGVRRIRKIKFENPSKGHASRWRRDHIIANFIRQHVGPGHSLEAAYEKAKARFHISRSVAQAIWQQHLADMKDAAERNLAGL